MWVKCLAQCLVYSGYLTNANLVNHHLYLHPHHYQPLIKSKKIYISRLAILVGISLLPWRVQTQEAPLTGWNDLGEGTGQKQRGGQSDLLPLWPENLLMKYPIFFSSMYVASFTRVFKCHLFPSSALLVDELVPVVVKKSTSITMGLCNEHKALYTNCLCVLEW